MRLVMKVIFANSVGQVSLASEDTGLTLASIDLVLSVSPLKFPGFCAEARGKVSALSLQFRNRRAAGKNQVGPPGKIGNGDLPGVNAEVAVNRRQKIAGRAHP